MHLRSRVSLACAALCAAVALQALPLGGAATALGAPPVQYGINTVLVYSCETSTQWGTWATNQVNSFQGLGANAIALAFPFYTDSQTSNAFYGKSVCGVGSKFHTPPPDFVAQVVDIAHNAGLTVLLRPYLDQTNLAIQSNYHHWKGDIAPTSPKTWFQNYDAALLPYLQMAQTHGVEHFAISTELESMSNAPYWPATIAAARKVYTGDLTFCASWAENGDEVPWPGTTPALDMYHGIPKATNNETPKELESGWERVLGTSSRLPDISAVTDEEVGIPAQDNSYDHPNGFAYPLNLYPFDQKIQANWYTMACSFVKKHHMRGIYFWGPQINLRSGMLLTSPAPNLTGDIQPLAQAAIKQCFTQ
jgi:hypothetical protein